MPDPIIFIVPAVPVAQPRPRAVIAHGGHGARIHEVTHIRNPETGERKPHPIAAFKASVRHEARAAYDGPPLTGPIRLRAVCVMPRPQSMYWKTRPMPRAYHISKPDGDNLLKSIKDALNKLLWHDDGQVAQATVEKWIAAGDEQPSVEITVELLAPPRQPEPQGGLFR